MAFQYNLPDLEERFLPPDNWESGSFLNPETKHNIHYSLLLPNNTEEMKEMIVTLPGLSEFTEKYIETAKFLTEHGYGVYIIDWAYQGRSTRYAGNPHKRYSDGYETDVSDLDFLIKNIIKSNLPHNLLAHSMGANIGMRYLLKHPNVFKAASFSAPMLGIRDLKYTETLLKTLLKISHKMHHRYIPGGRDWSARERKENSPDIFSNDPIRGQIHNEWCLSNPALQVGNVTLKWVYESLKSINILKKKESLRQITIPTLFSTPEYEKIVDNSAIKRAARIIPNAALINLKKSKHEILVETDEVRNKFLEETLKIFEA